MQSLSIKMRDIRVKMPVHLLLLAVLFSAGVKSQPLKNTTSTIERLSLDKGWKFYPGDIPFPEITGHDNTYNNAKAGNATGAASPIYNDDKWRLLNLPHDWAIEAPFDSTANISQAYKHRGIGWYRRHFKLADNDRGKNLEVQFDGISTYASIWLNGILVHRNFCGYTSSYIDISPFVKYGNEINTIAVRVDAVQQEGWWYEGAGIYRHTWLVKRSPVHIITDGVYANPVKIKNTEWQIPGLVTVKNTGKVNSAIQVEMGLYSKTGKLVANKTASASISVLNESTVPINISVSNPELWDIDNPVLYTVKTSVRLNGILTDELITKCGFRTTRFDADSGFYLNDKYLKIQGVCNHQDHAGVGVAVPDALWSFRLKKLKELGANAYRCAHNPPAKEFLEACDSLGIMVMDENRIFNSSPEYLRQLEWMVRRDRNHPSIILWSVFNEEWPVQGTEIGYEMVRRMFAGVKRLDTTRPVTAAMNDGLFTPVNVSQAVDVVGFNYQIHLYDSFHVANPLIPLTSSEDASAFMVRGEFVTHSNKHILSSYDEQAAPWGATHRKAWKAIADRRYLAGSFVWTGFDYHGEPAPYKWPTASSNFGILDLCGFPKTAYYIHQTQWLPKTKLVLQIVPHWNWPGDSIGKIIKVLVVSNAEKVSLSLNGKLLGNMPVNEDGTAQWDIAYKPGTLKAIGYNGEKEVAESIVETSGGPVAIELIADRSNMPGDGLDVVPVTVRVLDAKGRAVPTANNMIEFSLDGPGEIIGLGNGNPNSHEAEKGNSRSLFNGLAQVLLQSKANGQGILILKATSANLKTGVLAISIKKIMEVAEVPAFF